MRYPEYDYSQGPFTTRPIGRPRMYDRGVQVRLTKEQADAVDAYMDTHDVIESEAVRQIMDLGISALQRDGVLSR